MLTITIKLNRIYFEAYECPCGEPEVSEVRTAWESAAICVIEAAGYAAEIKVGVEYNPSRQWYLGWEEAPAFDWSGPKHLRPKDHTIACPLQSDCDEAEEIWQAVLPIVRRDAERVAEAALEAAHEAAQRLSDHFVAESETQSTADEDLY